MTHRRKGIGTTMMAVGVVALIVATWAFIMLSSDQITQGNPVEVVSVIGPIPPYNPGGPVISVTLKNVGGVAITSLDAAITLAPPPYTPFVFIFNASPSSPLLPGQSVQETRTVIGGGFEGGQDYPLAINGTFVGGGRFSYTVEVQVVAPD